MPEMIDEGSDFSTCADDTLDCTNWNFQNSITKGTETQAIAVVSDGSKSYVTIQGANAVSVIDIATHAITKTIVTGTKLNGIDLKQ